MTELAKEVSQRKATKSEKIVSTHKKHKERIKRLSEEEKEERLKMTGYVTNLLGYKTSDNNYTMKPPASLFQRLEGLRCGEYIPTGKDTGIEYPYDVIRFTFMAMAGNIRSALKSVDFKDESHKINYILVIIEKNINDIYASVLRNKKAKEKLDKMETDFNPEVADRFINTEKPKSAELFGDDMW